ncbi:unnamed protein product [Brachionus calyciflorus]|uniref:Uncharacterized protein n=1 Tax=Brachionus calyciflorus TaxID=104777 RepID=A0A814AFZ4_9BILA|nr:unnamed protein product [Brachionus calyciflorus]
MNYKQLVRFIKDQGISFNKTVEEIREVSIKKKNMTQISELVLLKKSLLDDETSSVYSNRTLTTVTESMMDDSNIKKYEKERLLNKENPNKKEDLPFYVTINDIEWDID